MRIAAMVGAVVLLAAGVPDARAMTWQDPGRGFADADHWESKGGTIGLRAADEDCVGPSYLDPGKGWAGAAGRWGGGKPGGVVVRTGFADRFGSRLGFPGGWRDGGGSPFGAASPVPVPAGFVLMATAAAALGAAGLRRRTRVAG